ncbi:hypothetical protein BV20DRAFT_1120308, partial [Pilatotrama ljubarskyi]
MSDVDREQRPDLDCHRRAPRKHNPFAFSAPPVTPSVPSVEATATTSAPETHCTTRAMAPQIDEDTQAFIQATVQTLVERFPTSSPRPKVKEPDTFDGTKARYDAWKQELQLYVGSMDKDRAITTIVSFIRGDHIERWRRVFCKKHHL